MKRILAGLFVLSAPVFAAPPCTAGTFGNVVQVCNLSYDATIPSGQTFARTVGLISYPNNAVGNLDGFIINGGKGWNETNANVYTTVHTLSQNLVNLGYAVMAPYTTWAAGLEVAAAHSAGDTSITVRCILNNGSTCWWPNLTSPVCADGCAGISVPFTAIYGQGASQETITCNTQTGNGFICAITALVNNHSALDPISLPKTQFPANVADYASFLNWVGTNGPTYHMNPLRLHLVNISSDSQGALEVVLSNHGICLSTCSPTFVSYWGSTIGNNGGSSNIASAWQIVSITDVSVPWDLNYMYTNGTSGCGSSCNVQSALRAYLGCITGVDTGCAAAASGASPVNLLATATYHGILATATGNSDFTTPPCSGNPALNTQQTWAVNQPCAGNMYAASAKPFVVFLGAAAGHGGDLMSNPTQSGQDFPWMLATALGGQAAVGGNSQGSQ